MRKIVPSMSDLFPACNSILEAELRPIRYDDLAKKAVEVLGYQWKDVDDDKVVEDVREKLPMRSDFGIAYSGAPHCLMAKSHWFNGYQLPLLNSDTIRIPGNAWSGVLGAFEALMRSPTMLDKWNGDVNKRNHARAKGLVIEQHVTDWFAAQWPAFYHDPENHEQWEKHCDHDFQLWVDGKNIHIDVAGLGKNGCYGGSHKRTTHFHLMCRADQESKDIFWEGVVSGAEFSNAIFAENAVSPVRFVVWLNCNKFGIDYSSFVHGKR